MKQKREKQLTTRQESRSGAAQGDDRRIRRTRRALAGALMELAAAFPYETITIRDIADRADIGYATFFRHYDSKDDLMLDIFQTIAADLEAVAGEHGASFFEQEGLLIFAHVQANESLYRGILDSLVFTRKLRRLFADLVERHVREHMPDPGEHQILMSAAVHHMVAALIGMIEWWLEGDRAVPLEHMAELYDRLIIRATWHALLANPSEALPWEEGGDGLPPPSLE